MINKTLDYFLSIVYILSNFKIAYNKKIQFQQIKVVKNTLIMHFLTEIHKLDLSE